MWLRTVAGLTFSAECGMRSAECGMRSAECGVRSAECEVNGVKPAIRNPKFQQGPQFPALGPDGLYWLIDLGHCRINAEPVPYRIWSRFCDALDGAAGGRLCSQAAGSDALHVGAPLAAPLGVFEAMGWRL